jgi:hypothetical protein
MQHAQIAPMSVRDEERNVLDEYHVSVQGFHDSLKGLSSAMEEAHARCERARRACEELRTACEREKTQRKLPRSSAFCTERDRCQEQCGAAVASYHDVLNSVELSSSIVVDGAERERIERARNACNYAFKLLEDHEHAHGCLPKPSARGSANASCA